MSDAEIARQVGCSGSMVSYYLNPNIKKKISQCSQQSRNKLKQKLRAFFRDRPTGTPKDGKQDVIIRVRQKFAGFFSLGREYGKREKTQTEIDSKMQITSYDDLIDNLGPTIKCYLTGVEINLYEPSTYQLDHIIPRSRGGQNTLENMGICIKAANQAKQNMTNDEFINLCKMILNNMAV